MTRIHVILALALVSWALNDEALEAQSCQEFTVQGTQGGGSPLRTGWIVQANEPLHLKAYGSTAWTNPGTFHGPLGQPRAFFSSMWLPSARRLALVAQIGGVVFEIGEEWSGPAPASGEVLLGVNDDVYGDNRGFLKVYVMPCQPGPQISLFMPVPGSRVDIEVEYVTPNASVAVVASLKGSGPSNSACGVLNVGKPFRTLRGQADAQGRAVLSPRVPPIAGRTNAWLQAIDLSNCAKSPNITRTINP